jgi:hypothetical protein
MKTVVSSVSGVAPAPSSSQAYLASGGCISGNSLISEGKYMRDIKPNDIIQGKRVLYVFRHAWRNLHPFVSFANGLTLTPYHPIIYEGEWIFPINHPYGKQIKLTAHEADDMWDIIFENPRDNFMLNMNGMTVATLGHQSEDPTLKHELFGNSEKILQSMSKYSQDENKIYQCHVKNVIRDPITRLIVGI